MATAEQKHLRARIKELETQQEKHKEELKAVLKIASDEFQPKNIANKLISGFVADKKFRNDIFSTIYPIVTSFVSNTFIKRSSNLKSQILVALSQLGISSAANHTNSIKNYSRAIFALAKESVEDSAICKKIKKK